MGNVAWCCSELFCWKIATNKRDHCAIPWRWPNCHQSKTCCPIARTWVGIDRNMRCYKSLLNLIARIEGTSYSIMQAYRDLHALQFHEDPCSISEYISNRLLGKDFLDIMNCTRENITPAMFSRLQQCCATSCAVERSFSLLKKLLSKERNFLPDNLKKYFIFYYNHAAKEIHWIVPYTPFQIKSYIKSYFDKR